MFVYVINCFSLEFKPFYKRCWHYVYSSHFKYTVHAIALWKTAVGTDVTLLTEKHCTHAHTHHQRPEKKTVQKSGDTWRPLHVRGMCVISSSFSPQPPSSNIRKHTRTHTLWICMTEDFAWGHLGSKFTINMFWQVSYKKVLTEQCNG